MAKKKTPISARSDIPFLQRKQMEKYAIIKGHRDEAAMIAMQVACVALNDTEGLGYQRLSRFARRLKVLIDEYYLAHIGEAKNYCPYCGAKMDL